MASHTLDVFGVEKNHAMKESLRSTIISRLLGIHRSQPPPGGKEHIGCFVDQFFGSVLGTVGKGGSDVHPCTASTKRKIAGNRNTLLPAIIMLVSIWLSSPSLFLRSDGWFPGMRHHSFRRNLLNPNLLDGVRKVQALDIAAYDSHHIHLRDDRHHLF